MSGEYTEHEEHVIQILKSTQPIPRQGFYRQMSGMPWQNQSRRFFTRIRWAAVGLAALLALTIWLVPPLRALAQEVLDTLFNRAGSDTYTNIYVSGGEESSEFSPSLEGILSALNDSVRLPTYLPEGFVLEDGGYQEEFGTSTLVYHDVYGGRYLLIWQFPVESERSGTTSPIGESAVIESVQIGDWIGEYVQGTWIVSAPSPSTEAGTTVEETGTWNANAAVYTLRWHDQEWKYEIVLMGGSGDIPDRDLMLNDLIAVAESLE